jgi:hypothetical protein
MRVHAATVRPGVHRFEDRLWADYRLLLNALDVEGNQARAHVEGIRESIDGNVERVPLVVSLRRYPGGWRIAAIDNDPNRQPKEQKTGVTAYGTTPCLLSPMICTPGSGVQETMKW